MLSLWRSKPQNEFRFLPDEGTPYKRLSPLQDWRTQSLSVYEETGPQQRRTACWEKVCKKLNIGGVKRLCESVCIPRISKRTQISSFQNKFIHRNKVPNKVVNNKVQCNVVQNQSYEFVEHCVHVYMAGSSDKRRSELGESCRGMPLVRISVQSIPCFAGIDTGADFCLMSSSLADKVLPNWKSVVYPVPLTMSGVTGHELELYGAVDLLVHIETNKCGRDIITQFIIWNNKVAPLLLGNQWLREMKASVDPQLGLRLPSNEIVPTYCRKKCVTCVRKWEEVRQRNVGSSLYSAKSASDAYFAQTMTSRKNVRPLLGEMDQ